MNKSTKATMQDLIARKMQREADRFKTMDIYVPSMDRILTFKKPADDVLLDAIDEMGEGNMRSMIGGIKKLVYLCCDILQNPELHKELGVTDPFETVDALFDLSDLNEIGEQLSDFVGIGDTEKKIKNS